jgi:hypothetical protein
VPLATEILGALVAGALIVVVARELGLESRRAFGAVSLVALSVAAVLAVPGLRNDVSALLNQRSEYAGMSQAEAQVRGGADLGINVGFLGWVHEQMKEGETFRLEIGAVPGEELFEGAGVNQATNFAWATYQLAPNLLVGQSSSIAEMESGEAQSPDWIVFYGKNPEEYEGKLGEVLTYEPGFAIARTADAS